MDLRLTLLLVCLCSQRVTNAEVAENESIPLVPLIPLMPSQPIEKIENESTPQPINAHTTEAPLLATAITSMPNGNSSEEEEDEGCLSVGRSQLAKEAIAAAIQKLGVQLLQNLETTPEQPNVIISPLSISVALSQLALGAVNETKDLLMHHLHENTVPCYNHALYYVLGQLRNNDLQIATRIFLRQGFQPKPAFVLESRRLYGSEPAVLESLQQINDWVENATNGKMTDFLSSLPPNLLLMLINAVHFKGEWKARFDPRFTSRGVFYLDDKRMVDVEVMEDAKHPLRLFLDNELEAQVACFPFLNSMSLLVVMPMSGQLNVSSLSAKLNISDLYRRLPRTRAVQVKFPKFKLEYAQDLQDVFTKLGLGDMFSRPNLADMADGPLLVSSVKHKSNMEINEEGAEAAAATTVVISRASNPVFHLSQPFFFALMDDMTQVPVFMGVINNPNPGAPISERGEFGSKDKVGFPIDKDHVGPFKGPPK
ncbi:serpin peptidase inhibitor, clade F (alpha-2 antiplasmin, pigment epithelium derived factor), member 2b [Anoplopoma fimbria]|uniref:serpin peptidase inhibitor, clade F (alpha-2 antiplasmin, pigment epithelium derived factor), member 2b n=1 Tax=Anoplopoma fimbria TaxID=229290 RepID=UPI0023EC1A50|nr:serpin peptidase inhibitor, clade F (alpha-2 antiplasmin, pigment epithelium derived factor), member 2b [Anoplopoma fimbria]XP_054453614.1 serpin peptidase inhibitor, clade F (alpha-2 antiplasmin, pigment epithelium derived factor), member 2b [Anoplopoma fimbria]XP_054453622.1 serpin peptidase inhibitor, clade F (alpha-2 antiplasmin, pigment epithelium derived factor), member 2b [Anoplopoma fimbria]XP_054453631.1 serpin peptidase inhibitor, clade F (alpha-2 antiplasmin, pigment epithelium der